MWCEEGIPLGHLACGQTSVQHRLLKTILPLSVSASRWKSVGGTCVDPFPDSVPLTCVSVPVPNLTPSVTTAWKEALIPASGSPPTSSLSFSIIAAILGPLDFRVNFGSGCHFLPRTQRQLGFPRQVRRVYRSVWQVLSPRERAAF